MESAAEGLLDFPDFFENMSVKRKKLLKKVRKGYAFLNIFSIFVKNLLQLTLMDNVMGMRRIFFLAVMSLVAFGSSIAQSVEEKTPVDLRGVWQLSLIHISEPTRPY